tara:strand:- start:1096 stop:1254 length:159 start_codon:yes stop_codon:yes gene_type:complete
MTHEELIQHLLNEIESLEEEIEDSREQKDWINLVKAETLQWHCSHIIQLIKR